MASTVAKTVLVTGANRGLGLEFVKQLLSKSNYEVIATCRTPSTFPFQQLPNTARLTLLPLDLTSPESIQNIPVQLTNKTLDVIIHNAGISSSTHPVEPVLSSTREDLLSCFTTNTLGTFELSKLLIPFMSQSSVKKMLFLSSKMGSIEATQAYGNDWTSSVSYRVSKAALNMSVRCLAYEIGGNGKDGNGICFTLVHPGWVDTDMGSAGNRTPPLTPEESVRSMLNNVIEVMECKTHNGEFFNYDGTSLPW